MGGEAGRITLAAPECATLRFPPSMAAERQRVMRTLETQFGIFVTLERIVEYENNRTAMAFDPIISIYAGLANRTKAKVRIICLLKRLQTEFLYFCNWMVFCQFPVRHYAQCPPRARCPQASRLFPSGIRSLGRGKEKKGQKKRASCPALDVFTTE